MCWWRWVKEPTTDVNVSNDTEYEKNVTFEEVVAINRDICEDLNYFRAVSILRAAFKIEKKRIWFFTRFS